MRACAVVDVDGEPVLVHLGAGVRPEDLSAAELDALRELLRACRRRVAETR